MIHHKLDSCSKFDIPFKRVLTYDNKSSDEIPFAICTVQAAIQTWWGTASAQHHVTQTGLVFAVMTLRDVNNVAVSFLTWEKWFILNSYDLQSLIYKATDYLGQDSSHLILTKLQTRHLKYLNCLESCHQWRRMAPPHGSPAYPEISTQAGNAKQPQAAWWCRDDCCNVGCGSQGLNLFPVRGQALLHDSISAGGYQPVQWCQAFPS